VIGLERIEEKTRTCSRSERCREFIAVANQREASARPPRPSTWALLSPISAYRVLIHVILTAGQRHDRMGIEGRKLRTLK